MTQKFFTGDLVSYQGSPERPWIVGEKHIIYECSYQGGGDFEYSTDKGAWFTAKDFKLIYRATKDTFKRLDDSFGED